jgi:hypothetical protein
VQRSPRPQRARDKKKPRQLALTGFLTLEARAGVEPTYTDLQYEDA